MVMPATLTSRIPEIMAALEPRADAAAKAVAEVISERAIERAPVGPEPYHIRDDIYVADAGDESYAVVAGRSHTYYGHILEFGGRSHSPHPFLIPAFEETLHEAEDIGARVMRGL